MKAASAAGCPVATVIWRSLGMLLNLALRQMDTAETMASR
jgi:hypothetical protein